MNGRYRSWKLLLLLPLLLVASCDNSSTSEPISSEDISELPLIPEDYEIDETVTNADGGVYYEIFVRSFADSNRDGHGDLTGIKMKIPYLANLGVKGLWLTPIHPSPSDHGYDVTNYLDINKDFGTLSDFDALINEASDHNIDVIIDLVINHSGTGHPWFEEGFKNFRNNNFDPQDEDNKANWYYFKRNGAAVEWEASFPSMADLNLSNSKVKAEVVNIAKFWLDRGVKGFRLDATSHFFPTHTENIAFLSWFKDEVRAYKADAYIVGEAWIRAFGTLKSYFSGIDSLFNFAGADVNGYIIDRITAVGGGATIAHHLNENYNDLYAVNDDAQMAMFLTNHDMDRSSQMFLFDFDERQRVAATIYLLTPGVPFMYYGEEIALKGSRRINPTDANRRLPMIWQKTGDDMRPNPLPNMDYPIENQVRDGVLEHLAEPFSLLNHYRKVISVRNAYPWLDHARLVNFPLNNNAIASLKLSSRDSDDFIHVIHNVSRDEVEVNLSRFISDYDVKIAHDIYVAKTRAILTEDTLTLAPYSSVVLERK